MASSVVDDTLLDAKGILLPLYYYTVYTAMTKIQNKLEAEPRPGVRFSILFCTSCGWFFFLLFCLSAPSISTRHDTFNMPTLYNISVVGVGKQRHRLNNWSMVTYKERQHPLLLELPELLTLCRRTRFSLSVENEQAGAERDDRTRLARPNSQARTGTGIFPHPLFS